MHEKLKKKFPKLDYHTVQNRLHNWSTNGAFYTYSRLQKEYTGNK